MNLRSLAMGLEAELALELSQRSTGMVPKSSCEKKAVILN